MTTRDHREIPKHIGEWLRVDETIKEGLRWKKDKGRAKEGDIAGCLTIRNGAEYYVTKFEQKTYLNHRIIYFLKTGEDPENNLIDHVDEDKNNQKIRIATVQENVRYRRKSDKTKGKYKGVSFNKRDKMYYTKLTINGKSKYVGCFKSEEEAARAYDEAAIQAYGEFAYLNFPPD